MNRRSSKKALRRNFASGVAGTREAPVIIERIDDVEEFLGSPGFYQAGSAFPAYAVAKALDGWHPLFKGGMDLPFVEGNIFFFEVLGTAAAGAGGHQMRANPYVRMGVAPDHWIKLLDRYVNWELAWWREVAQNARDAGATQLDFDIKQGVYTDESGQQREAMVVSAFDNGGGMTADVLRKALLTVSGSHKTSTDPAGGFGDAKNLILFPWLGWKVQTNDLEAEGHQDEVREEPDDVIPGVRRANMSIGGTRVTVWMELMRTTTEDHAKLLLGRCYLPTVRCRVNGKDVSADLTGGEVIAESDVKGADHSTSVGKIQVRYQRKPKNKVHGMYVRGRGIYMFEESIDDEIPGVIYVDADAPARFVFESNRNTLINNVKWWLEGIKRNLAKDPDIILRSKKWMTEKFYEGTGTIDARKGRAAEVAARATAKVADQLTKRISQKKAPSKKEIEDLVQEVAEAYDQEEPQDAGRHVASSRDTASKLVSASVAQAMTVEQVATAVRFAMWQPDFLLINSIPFWKAPASIEPETMEAKYVVLLRAWAEACKFALNVLGEFKPFGVGFCMFLDGKWGRPVRGAYKHSNNVHWLMVCPFTFKQGEWVDDAESYKWTTDSDLFDLSTDAGVEELCSIVIHEITHLQGFGDHDTAYASALTKNMKIAHRGLFDFTRDQIKTIKAETRARFAEVRQEKAAAKSIPWPLVVGRVTLILEFWDSLRSLGQQDLNDGRTEIDTVAKDAGRHDHQIKAAVSSVMEKTTKYKRQLDLKPKVIVKLHDAALATGAFKLVTDEEAIRASEVWNSIPDDPRGRQKLEATTPDGTFIFSWVRTGKEWILREGFIGQRGAEVWRYEGGMGSWDRGRQRQESTGHIVDFLNKKKAEWSGSENFYVWYATSASEWYLRVDKYGRATTDSDDADYMITVDTGSDNIFVFSNGFPGIPMKTHDTPAKAQQTVMEAIFQRRKEQSF